jgi:adenine deaminase
MKFFFMLLLPLQLLAQHPIIFKNVSIVDVKKGAIIPNQHILIEGERIRKISSKPIAHGSATIIDANGKYMIPGLCDFNAEVLIMNMQEFRRQFIAGNGVTSVRDLKPEQNLGDVFAARTRLQTENT